MEELDIFELLYIPILICVQIVEEAHTYYTYV